MKSKRFFIFLITLSLIFCSVYYPLMKVYGNSNIALGKMPTSNSALLNKSIMTDGDKTTNNFTSLTSGLKWVQLDLGSSYNVEDIKLWHYFGDNRQYHDVIVQLSNDATFSTGVVTVFNNDSDNSSGLGAGTDSEYQETIDGKDISFNPSSAKFVRIYGNGSTINGYTHYVEVEVYGSETVFHATSVTLNKNNDALAIGKTDNLAATVLPENASEKSVTWTSSDTGIAAVSSSGQVTGVSAGTATITATTVDGGFTATCEVKILNNIAQGKVPSSSTTLTNKLYVTDGDKTASMYASTNAGLKWVQLDLGSSYNVEDIKLWHYFGDKRQYHDVIVQLSNDSTFSTGVVTVFNNDSDNSSGLGAGTDSEYQETSDGRNISFNPASAKFVRIYGNGSTVNAFTHYVEVEVYGSETVFHPTSVTLNKNNDALAIGRTDNLAATVLPENAAEKSVTWTSSDAGVAGVSSSGQVTGVSAGTATITATTVDGGFTATCEVTVTEIVHPSSVSLNKTTDFVIKGGTDTLTAAVLPENSTEKSVTWTSSDAGVAGVSSSGQVTGLSAGTATITATTVDGGLTATCEVKVLNNIALGKVPSSSTTLINKLYAADGDKNTSMYASTSTGLNWVQLYFGPGYNMNTIKLWHYFGDKRQYHDVIVQLSNDSTFSTGVVTVFNNDSDNSSGFGAGTNSEYQETSDGKNISFNPTSAMYVRIYGNGSTVNAYTHYVEIEAYGERVGMPSTKAKLLFTFDDGAKTDITVAAPILAAKGFKATSYVVKNFALYPEVTDMSVSDLNKLYVNYGWDIANHTDNHLALPSYSENPAPTMNYLEKSYLDNQNWIISKHWVRGAYHVAYPFGSYNAELIIYLKTIGVKTGRTPFGGIQPVPVTNKYEMLSEQLRNNNIDEVYRVIDDAVNTGSTLFLTLHMLDNSSYEYATSPSNFQLIVNYVDNYVKQGKLDVNTISEWYNSQ